LQKNVYTFEALLKALEKPIAEKERQEVEKLTKAKTFVSASSMINGHNLDVVWMISAVKMHGMPKSTEKVLKSQKVKVQSTWRPKSTFKKTHQYHLQSHPRHI
jgi:hypothetical protein